MKPSHDQILVAEPKLSRALESAWKAALDLTGCVQCAGQEITRRVSMQASETDQWIIGNQPDRASAAVPQERRGISMTCEECAPA